MKNALPQLSEDLVNLLSQARKLSAAATTRLKKAAEELDEDPSFRAELLKGLFVEHIQDAMDQGQISQSDLARRWGKSRQYLSKVLSEDKRINFTIETMAELAALVGRKLELILLNPHETAHVLRCNLAPRNIASLGESPVRPSKPAISEWLGGFEQERNFKGDISNANRLSA